MTHTHGERGEVARNDIEVVVVTDRHRSRLINTSNKADKENKLVVARQLVGWVVMLVDTGKMMPKRKSITLLVLSLLLACFYLVLLVSHFLSLSLSHFFLSFSFVLVFSLRSLCIDSSQDLCRLTLTPPYSISFSISKTSSSFSLPPSLSLQSVI